MDFLLEAGFSEDLVNKIKQKYEESILDIVRLDQENVLDVINYFQEIGINKVDQLLLSHIEVFTKDIEEVKTAFQKYNLGEIVEKINKDISVIDYI